MCRQYVSRPWAATAEVMITLIDNLPPQPEMQLVRLLPHGRWLAGRHSETVRGQRLSPGSESVWIEVASAASTTLRCRWDQVVPESGAPVEFVEAEFRIERDVEDIELKVLVGPESRLRIDAVEFVPQADFADRAPELAAVN